MIIQRQIQFVSNGELLYNLCLLKRISVVTIVIATCSVTYNGKFRYSLAWRCLKATIILRFICIMPSASHVNHFDKLNGNGLCSLFLSLSLYLDVSGSLGEFRFTVRPCRTSYTAIQFFDIRYDIK